MTDSISYAQGLLAGRISLILYLLTLVPGISRRLGVKHRLISLLTLYRQKVGIAMYVFALLHLVSFFPSSLKLPLFHLFGLSAFLILLPLFLTANSYSIKRLKGIWKKIHRLTYPAMGLIFLHTVLIGTGFFSITAFMVFLLLVVSFIVDFKKKRPVIIK